MTRTWRVMDVKDERKGEVKVSDVSKVLIMEIEMNNRNRNRFG